MDKLEFDRVKDKFEKVSKRQKNMSKLLNYVSILIATISGFFATGYLLDGFDTNKNNNSKLSLEQLQKINSKLELELYSSKKEIEKLKDNNIDSTNTNVSVSEVRSLKNQMEILNAIIIENPEKALTIPLLKIQIQNQKEQNEKEMKSLKDDISRVYDMNKWIIGLVFTMLVSIIVLNISNLLARNKKE